MFIVECIKSSDCWNLTEGDVYRVLYDGENSEWLIKDDIGTLLHLERIGCNNKFKLLADDDVVFLVLDL